MSVPGLDILLPVGSRRRSLAVRVYREAQAVGVAVCQYLIPPFRSLVERCRELAPKHRLSLENTSTASPLCSLILPAPKSASDVYCQIRSMLQSNPGDRPKYIVMNAAPRLRERLSKLVPGLLFMDGELAEIIGRASGRYVVVMSRSSIRIQGDITGAISAMREAKAALLEPRLILGSGRLQESGGHILPNGVRHELDAGRTGGLGAVTYTKEIDCPLPLNFIADREMLARVQADASFSPLYRMADLSFQLRQIGLSTLYYPPLVFQDLRFRRMEFASSPSDREKFLTKWSEALQGTVNTRARFQPGKTVLVVDERIPRFDTSAGDRNTFNYLEVLTDMGFTVKFIPGDFHKTLPYSDILEKMGIEIVGCDGRSDMECLAFLKKHGHEIEYAIINRPLIGKKFLPLLKKWSQAKIFYSCQDLHFLRMEREMELDGKNDAARIAALRRFEAEELALADSADVVLTVSEYEGQVLKEQLKKAAVEICPIFIYDSFPQPDFSIPRRDLIFVGGLGHAPNLDGLIWFCRDILSIVQKSLPNIRLYLVGGGQEKFPSALKSPAIQLHGFLSDSQLADLYGRCRLAVVPLRYGAGVKGKLVEAMYHGLPVVSTSVGTEGLPDITHCIESADTESDFAACILKLCLNTDAQWQCISLANQEYVKQHFSEEVCLRFFHRILGAA